MPIQQYVEQLNKRYRTGISREHSYRGDLQNLLQELAPGILVTNEPARVACGAPDYILTRGQIPVGYIEAKDIGADLTSKAYREQFDRYRESLSNLIITNYHDFHLYRSGELVDRVSIASTDGSRIVALPDQFGPFQDLIQGFVTTFGTTIRSAQKLSLMMANKARLMRQIFQNTLEADIAESDRPNTPLQDQYQAFKDILIHDIEPQTFADIYAQTIAYGMFAARLHDPTLDDFSRQEAATLIPKTNPFLRKLFQYIAGYDLDERLSWIVDDLTDIFRATDVAELLRDFGTATGQDDPMIHFYETFLAAYDPRLRKSRGVWYTPQPVVNFIVRAVDDILRTEFGLRDGLADRSTTRISTKVPTSDARSKGYKTVEQEVHRVQILDPATGTGTFLAEVVRQIYRQFQGQEGMWSQYVDDHLLPRLHGFEILMASYAMAHLKLDLLLSETGYRPTREQRFRVYLTNSLEEHHPDTGTLFASWLSDEANQANHVKRDTPVMVVLGNPPYSGISSNMGEWISNLIEDYKYVDGQHFGERKHWLHDDYVKFIRYGQHFVEKNGEGVLAYINNHSFLDNPTFRGMRWHLLKTFDKIYVIDLHGNSLKKETAPDGSKDENVFDIQAGVSINLMVKTGKKKPGELAKVYNLDVYGKRDEKYQYLLSNNLETESLSNIQYSAPYYFFIPRNEDGKSRYESGFPIHKLFVVQVTGVLTARDHFVIDFDAESLIDRMKHFTDDRYSDHEIRSWLFPRRVSSKYLTGDTRGWKLTEARNKIRGVTHTKYIQDYDYRPFDVRKIYYHSSMVDWGRENVMRHLTSGKNFALMVCRQSAIQSWEHISITRLIADDSRISNRSRERGYILPLYLYPSTGQQTLEGNPTRQPNLDPQLVKEIAGKLGLTFTPEKEDTPGTFAPIDLLDYIYAVLHSPAYREKYKEFLKIDFPRVPYPVDQAKFWQLVALGGQLRQLHLLEADTVDQFITTYPQPGDNTITRKLTKASPGYEPTSDTHGRVWINDEQYFNQVPLLAWEFHIGGYQPAQKWLKDRTGRTLSVDDILHYQRIIVALSETHRLMLEVDEVGVG